MDQTLTIQQVAEISGLGVHTLRYYERIGLLGPVERTDNGYRSYSEGDVAWIQFLNRLRVTGMPIRTMQQFASLRRHGDATVRERRELLEEHEKDILDSIAELERNLREITRKINGYKTKEADHDARE